MCTTYHHYKRRLIRSSKVKNEMKTVARYIVPTIYLSMLFALVIIWHYHILNGCVIFISNEFCAIEKLSPYLVLDDSQTLYMNWTRF